jgi:predicted phage tail protein
MYRVHLHGPFKAFYDGVIEIAADTAWEAIEAVTRQLPGFQPDLNGRKAIQVPGYDTVEKLKTPGGPWDLHIMPALSFGKNGGLIQTLIGVTLIVAGFIIHDPFLSPILVSVGLGMVIGGVMQMFTPQPKLTTDNAQAVRSKYLPSTQNTVRIGTTIPLLYGRARCGGQILSLEIIAKNAPVK